jgi:hypothetical protein
LQKFIWIFGIQASIFAASISTLESSQNNLNYVEVHQHQADDSGRIQDLHRRMESDQRVMDVFKRLYTK